MKSRAKHHVADNGAKVEVGIIVHEGREFASLGSIVDHERGYVVGYLKLVDNPKPGESRHVLTSWEGRVIGTCRVISTWKTPRSWVSSTMSSYRATVDGIEYHGSGDGMLLRLRRCK